MTSSTLRLAVAAAGLTLAATTGSLVGVAAAQADPTPPAPDTIVRVTGDAQTGFGIKYYDGSSDFPRACARPSTTAPTTPPGSGRRAAAPRSRRGTATSPTPSRR